MTKLRTRGLRLVCAMLCLACLFSMARPVSAAEETAPSEFIYTVLVHYGPSAGSAVIGQLEDGTAVTVLGTRGSFYKVDCYDTTGYIAQSQVRTKADGTSCIDCDPASSETRIMPTVSWANALRLRAEIMAQCERYIGVRYVYGGTTPRGFDCSGYTQYVYGSSGYTLYRCSADQLQDGLIVSRDGLQVGDLVFFREGRTGQLATHVGIYAGNNQIIHAMNKGVGYSDLDVDWYAKYYIGARRVINVSSSLVDTTPEAAVAPAARTGSSGLRTVG